MSSHNIAKNCRQLTTIFTELQIRGGIEDNSKIYFSYFSTKTYFVTNHKNRLDETVLMMDYNIRFEGVIWKSSLNYGFNPSYQFSETILQHKQECLLKLARLNAQSSEGMRAPSKDSAVCVRYTWASLVLTSFSIIFNGDGIVQS